MAGLFREDKADPERVSDRPIPQHKRLIAKLPAINKDLGDELIRGSIQALSWAAREVQRRRKKKQKLVRLIDGQHRLWSDADACLSDSDSEDVIEILGILPVSGYVGKAARILCTGKAAWEAFIRDRLLRIPQGEVESVIRGLRCLAGRQKLCKEDRGEVETT